MDLSHNQCSEPGCIRPCAPQRRVCWGCHKRKARQRDPLWAAWRKIRDRARSRGIPFRLPLPVFREMAVEVGYVERTGRHRDALHMDRIDARRGYEVGNLQFLVASENCSKGAYERGRVLILDEEKCPF